ncbi:MAG: TraR/DksA C4-type zinc finger protein [Saprospirales bacterium]|nr:TraR/DksA C4-type zinc finger protein [Saprospirales bacterium]MBK8490915.1 TraR/DksA C4-type zinc finger protein [Saprospirales bacterium]
MNQSEELTKLIREEIIKTKQRVKEYGELSQPISPENSIGRVSRMDSINNKSVVEAALREAESKLAGLKYALSRVDNPDFGICLRCQKPIPPKRLLLMPQSRYCVHCAQ